MRIDHHAYQRATRVAAFGLLIQIILGVTLLVLGIIGHDTAFQFASVYILCGVLVWVGLIIIFYQHKLERLESLEEDELSATRGGSSTSFFDAAASESRVAARRLAMMHKWLMPALSIVLALLLGGFAALMFRFMTGLKSAVTEFGLTTELGWFIAICLAFALVSFIFSRFVAGMAKQPVWQNLRGGASYMVGNALVLAAVSAGIVFRFFQNDSVIEGVGWAIPIFMGLQVLEIILNFILNLYRPRIPGEVPRPAFDSRVLSWFASPDSIVRSLNEAVNYQFGFDVTSSWGYQLLLRSFAWLVGIGILAMVLLNTMVVVEPHQQAVRLRGGAMVLDDQGQPRVYGSGIMWKRPWPFETAAVYDVTRVRKLYLTSHQTRMRDVNLWTDEIEQTSDTGTVDEFIVGSSIAARSMAETKPAVALPGFPLVTPTTQAAASQPDTKEAAVSNYYSLVAAEIVIQYRIKPTDNGLVDYLNFAGDGIARGSRMTERERALRDIALGEVSAHLSRLSLDEVLSPGLTNLAGDLQRKIRDAFEDPKVKAGVEVLSVDLPVLRPPQYSAGTFEELGMSHQASKRLIAYAQRDMLMTKTAWAGDEQTADKVVVALGELQTLSVRPGVDAAAIAQKKQQIEQMLRDGGGEAARMLNEAERDRWVTLMNAYAKGSQLVGQMSSYQAAPELYREHQIMEVYKTMLPHLNKYIIGIDPSRINVQMDLHDTNPLFNAASMINPESK